MSTTVVKSNKAKELSQKAEESAKKGVALLKKVPKPVYYGLGGIALYYVLLKPLVKDLRTGFNTDPGNDSFQKDKDQILDKGTSDGSSAGTLSDQEILSIAQGQLAYMDRPGTSNDIFNDLEGLSGKDLQRVYVAFGRKWYDPFLGVQSGSLFSIIGHQELDLFGWYRGELSPSELTRMRGIWQKSGLAFPGGNNMALS